MRKVSMLLLSGLFCMAANATTDPEIVTKLQGKNASNVNEITVGAWRETVDPVYYDAVHYNDIDNPANDIYRNVISLLIDEDDRKFITADFKVSITFDINWTDKNGNQQGPLSKTLTVDYKIAEGTKYDARNYFYFDNARKVKITITTIQVISGPSWATEVLTLENRMIVKRDYKFNTAATAQNIHAAPGEMNADNKFDELVVGWDQQLFKGFTHYDVEWTWVDIDALDRYKINNQFDATLLFKNNSTRVTITADHDEYKVPLIYDGSGYLFYRVRPLQYREDGDIKEGEWSAIGTNGITYYSYTNGHEPDLNWQVSTTYAEDGKRKTVISYFDGTLRSRQTVTKDNVNNNTVVAETMYDYQGRPVINILPAPTLEKVITYAKNFNRFTTAGYEKDLFDLVPAGQTICAVNTPQLDNNYGAAKYYSPNNPKVNEGMNKYIPDAEGYPYSETRYTPDATGRIASQGGVGPDYQLGNGKHATSYYYGYADQRELNALFGTEVGDQSHYFKNMVKDANGQFSVSYVDMHGRTVATALAGPSPGNLKALESNPEANLPTMVRNLLGRGNNIVRDRSIESNTTLLVSTAALHTFHYALTPQSAEIVACNPAGQTVCYDCYYDLEIRVTGSCGEPPVIITRKNFSFGNYDTLCSNAPPTLTVDTAWVLQPGEYNITKKLVLSKDAQDWYRDNLFTRRNICKTLTDFYNENYQAMLAMSNCGMTCTSCNAALGTYEQYRQRFLQSQGITNYNQTVPYENEIKASYDEAKENCDFLCSQPDNNIRTLREQLLDDMTPGEGQYAKQDVDLDGDGIAGEPGVVQYRDDDVNHEDPEWELNTTRLYNIFNTAPPFIGYRPNYGPGCTAYTPFYLHPKEERNGVTTYFYRNNYNERDENINPTGADNCNPVRLMLPDDFSNQFKDSFALSLLYYHPEYCKLKTIESNPALVSSSAWDAQLQNIDTWAAAMTAETNGYIVNSKLLDKDPFFNMSGAAAYKTTMTGFVNNNFRHGKSMWQYAMGVVKCTNTANPSCIDDLPAYPTSGGYGGTQSNPLCEADKNNAWRLFRTMYLTIKDSLLNAYLDQQCPGINYAQLKTLGYKRRFGHYADHYNTSITNAVNAITGSGGSTGGGYNVDDDLLAQYTANCESYIDMWKQQLLQCDQLAALSAGQQDEILNEITQQMKTVCIHGSDEDHPLGSSTIKPGDPWNPGSFEQIITSVFASHNISASSLCHPYLVDYPQPYTGQQPLSDETMSNTKDSCICARLSQFKQEQSSSGFTGTLSQFIQYQHGVYVPPSLLQSLSDGCGGSTNCNNYDPPVDLPGIFNCNSIYTTCISCAEYQQYKGQFIQANPAFTVIYDNPANTEEVNRNVAFEKYMNAKTGFRKSWMEYRQFEQECTNYETNWNCTSLDSLLQAFKAAYPNAGWGGNCEQLFTQYFNQAFGTNYTFATIQSLYMQYCGAAPDVCRPTIDCMAFKLVKQAFHTQYGSSVSGSPNCQQLFTAFFNNYFGTNYSWDDIAGLHQTLCGYDIDICTPLGEMTLRQILADWHSSHQLAWQQSAGACDSAWISYFNSHAYTNLAGWEINDLYSGLNITLDPCAPPATCEQMQFYINYYNNNGASCDSSGLNPNAPGYCKDCFTWYINHQLGTSLTYEQVGLLYKSVCNNDTLSVCGSGYECNKLTGEAATFISNGYTGNCYTAFAAYFNSIYGTSLNYEQVMAVYEYYCGSRPAVCGGAVQYSCEALTLFRNDFLEKYPSPSAYFGNGCQEAFTNSFNSHFGDTLNYEQIVNYYISLCGKDPEICTPVDCSQLQQILSGYNTEYGSYSMPQQLCRDMFTRWYNNAMSNSGSSEEEASSLGGASLEPGSSNNKLTWAQIQALYAGCGIALNICPPDGTQLLNCNQLEGARKAFYGFYNNSLPKEGCDDLFVSFFNLYFHSSFENMGALQAWTQAECGTPYNVCSGDTDPITITLKPAALPPAGPLPPRLCDAGPLYPAVYEPVDSCNKSIQTMALHAATEQYNIYVRQQKDDFDKRYKEKCLSAGNLEVFTVSSAVAEYHYTLYYYDQAGALVKTVPPAGVHPDYTQSFFDAVEASRESATGNPVVPNHTLATEYRYNALGQVVEQKSPDGGLSKFWYDKLGRLVVSQNAKQALTPPLGGAGGGSYSYTLYDYLGRITEVGQTASGTQMTQAISQSESSLAAWLTNAAGNREQITRTVYDEEQNNPNLCGNPYVLCQKNLRNRVSYTYVQPSAGYNHNNLPYSTATYYTYDIHGNVDILLQHYNDGVMNSVAGNAFKRMEYAYDLQSGKVNEVAYQPGMKDQYYHRYSYDAENKLTRVETSADAVYWQQQATYSYYRHGPLARTEIGQLGVQGVDYVYNLQGWIKGVNSSAITPPGGGAGGGYDPGADGGDGGRTARDAYSFSLNYNGNDYKPINSSVLPFAAISNGLPQLNADGVNTGKDLYNGNIKAMLVNIPKLSSPGGGQEGILYGYQYDQLNRITAMNAYSGLNNANNTFSATVMADYKERVTYDPNGDILTYLRNGSTIPPAGGGGGGPLAMDNLTYNYIANSNKLGSVNDAVAAGNYTTDIDNQNANNYDYDEIGNLVKDNQEGITNIEWTVYGKIKTITKSNGSTVSYSYDASGNRISKTVSPSGGGGQREVFYVRDGSGNVMAVYEKGNSEVNSGKLSQIEVDLYGSSRLGIWQRNLDVESTNWGLFETTAMAGTGGGRMATLTRGVTSYELSNHLGNVLVTVSDRKIQVQDAQNSQLVAYYTADVVSATDYYPFGLDMPGRKYGADGRYGFNGKERDGDIANDNYDFGARIYDGRIGRFLSIDKFISKTPFFSPYLFASNTPIRAIDYDGNFTIVVNVFETTVDPVTGSIITIGRGQTFLEVTTLEDVKGEYRTASEVNIHLLSTSTWDASKGEYFMTTSLVSVEDVKGTGLTKKQQRIKEEGWGVYYFSEFLLSTSKAMGMYQLSEVVRGQDHETGEELSLAEKWTRFGDAAVSFLTLGRAGAKGALLKWGSDMAIQYGIVEQLAKSIFGDNSKAAVFAYYGLKFIYDLKKGEFSELENLLDKRYAQADLAVKLSDFITTKMKDNMGVDINMPLDKDQALKEKIGEILQAHSRNKDSEQKVISNYIEKHE